MTESGGKYAKIKNEIQKKIDIVSLIEHYVPLKKTGNGYVGLCPFHNEKTPSFSVQPNAENGGFYHCFGCQKSGDAFTFIMEKEGLSFVESMKTLAREYGVLWDAEESKENPTDYKLSTRANLLKATEFAANFFYSEMGKSEEAKNYFRERKILGETAKEFRLGFAPDSYNKLLQAAKAKNIPENVLLDTALVRKNEKGVFDFFRNRVMFTIFDSSGRPVAFGGRAFGDEKPKYINSSNTPLYDKSKIFYGYFQAQNEIKAQKTAIIVEGYMDVLALYQSGIKNVVAPCGTSFSEEHASFLSRIAQKAVIALDGDEAGVSGAKKIVEKLLQFEIDIRYVLIPQNQDPDEFVKSENGKEKFLQLVENAQDGFGFFVEQTEKEYKVSNPAGKSKAIKEIASALSNVKNEIILSDYTTRISNRYKISVADIRRSVQLFRKKESADNQPLFLENQTVEEENKRIFYTEEGKVIHLFFWFPQILQEYSYEIPQNFFAEPVINKLYSLMRNGEFDRENFVHNENLSGQEKAFVMLLVGEKLTSNGENDESAGIDEDEARRQIAAKIDKFRIIEKQKENESLKEKIRETSDYMKRQDLLAIVDKNKKEILALQRKKRDGKNGQNFF